MLRSVTLHPGILASGAPDLLFLVVVFAALPAAAVLGLALAGRLELTRTVLVHAPAERVWEFVRHFPTLHERHGKARELCRITDWALRHGDGEGAGTVWRAQGTWDGMPYWADIEVVRADPGSEMTFSLRRDSLGTHRGLREHSGTLTLEAVGSDATKLTWRLRARLRGPRLILARMSSCTKLQARLFDQGLRSLKVEIDNAARQTPAGPRREADGPSSRPATHPPPPVRIPPGSETSA
jgi:hypothetical protein